MQLLGTYDKLMEVMEEHDVNDCLDLPKLFGILEKLKLIGEGKMQWVLNALNKEQVNYCQHSFVSVMHYINNFLQDAEDIMNEEIESYDVGQILLKLWKKMAKIMKALIVVTPLALSNDRQCRDFSNLVETFDEDSPR